MPGRIAIVLNAELPPPDILEAQLGWAEAVLAADGGAERLLARGRIPDAVVGDLDSLSAAIRARLGAERVHHVDDPHSTDLEKCVAWAVGMGAKAIHILGGAGRFDHQLASLAIVSKPPPGVDVRLFEAAFEVFSAGRGTRFEATIGTPVSLLAPSGAQGVSTTGLKWPLEDEDLPFGGRGVHNVVASSPVGVTVAEGDLLILKGYAKFGQTGADSSR